MKAILTTPGEKNIVRLEDIKEPVAGGHQVKVKVIQAGIDGTDLEIVKGLYGKAPPEKKDLVLGHEAIGEVIEVGPLVEDLNKGDLVVPTVRRPCPDSCLNCSDDEPDSCLTGNYLEKGIKEADGYLSEYFVEFEKNLVKLGIAEKSVGVLVEPLSVVEKAMEQLEAVEKRIKCEPKTALVLGAGTIGILTTILFRLKGFETYALATRSKESIKAKIVKDTGATYLNADENPLEEVAKRLGNIDVIVEATGNSSLAFKAMRVLGTNGVMILLGVSTEEKTLEICSDCINLEFVLGNKAVFGSVSSNSSHFEAAVNDFLRINMKWPELLERMITRSFPLTQFQKAFEKGREDIKTVIDFA